MFLFSSEHKPDYQLFSGDDVVKKCCFNLNTGLRASAHFISPAYNSLESQASRLCLDQITSDTLMFRPQSNQTYFFKSDRVCGWWESDFSVRTSPTSLHGWLYQCTACWWHKRHFEIQYEKQERPDSKKINLDIPKKMDLDRWAERSCTEQQQHVARVRRIRPASTNTLCLQCPQSEQL